MRDPALDLACPEEQPVRDHRGETRDQTVPDRKRWALVSGSPLEGVVCADVASAGIGRPGVQV